MKIKDLTPNAKNPRTITDAKRAMLKKALLEFGDLGGIVFNKKSKQLVGGHQRREIFDPGAPITIVKKYSRPTKTGTVAEGFIELKGERYSYREVFWDKHTEMAANIAANKGAGEWDLPELGAWLKELSSFDADFDTDLTMFDADELLGFKDITVGEHTRTGKTGVDEDDIPEKAPARTKSGDLYLMNGHRLMCGDSTKSDLIKKLMNGKKAEMVFTSPPYNGNTRFNPGKGGSGFGGGKNLGPLYENDADNKTETDYIEFCHQVLKNCFDSLDGFLFWNVNYNSNTRSAFLKQIIPFLDQLVETICWKKTALPVPHGLTRTWEPIFVFSTNDKAKRIGHANETEFNFWDISNIGALEKSHRAAFPVGLPEKGIELCNPGIVLDPFGGSGTTLIACEKTGCDCYTMELDPAYCDVIVERWEKYTGLKAKLVRAETKIKKTTAAKQPGKQPNALKETAH